MIDKNGEEWAPIETRGNRGEVNGSKRIVLFCGALMGVVFACNVCAETETSPSVYSGETAQITVTEAPPSVYSGETAQITVEVEQPVVVNPASEVITTTAGAAVAVELDDRIIRESNVVTASPNDQPLSDHQGMLKVASLQQNYDKQVAVVEKPDQGSFAFEKGNMKVPYAILLAMVALVGLVPVARRSDGI